MDLFGIKKLSQQINSLGLTVNSSLSSIRDRFSHALGQSHGGSRDVYTEFGYTHNPSFNQLYEMAVESPIANRLVFGMAKSCWRDGFEVKASEEEDSKDVLQDEMTTLINSGMLDKLERADALSRIGPFSCLFVGVPDGLDPSDPVGRASGGDALEKVFFKAFAYDGITVLSQVKDINNPRYGLPEFYQVQKMNRDQNTKDTIIETITVHWSRIVHYVESPLDSDLEGIPYLRPVYNQLLDLMKVSGGSSEAFFRNVQRIIVTELDKDMATYLLNNDDAKEKFDEASKEFTNKFQNQITTNGNVKALSPAMADPLNTFLISVYQITGYSGVPLRVLTGMGGGQYAGQEDQLAYNNIVKDRQTARCAPRVMDTLKILDAAGLVNLTGKEVVEFNVQEVSTEAQEAIVNKDKSTTFKNIVDGLSTIGGDGVDAKSVFSELGLGDVKTDSIDIDKELDEDLLNE